MSRFLTARRAAVRNAFRLLDKIRPLWAIGVPFCNRNDISPWRALFEQPDIMDKIRFQTRGYLMAPDCVSHPVFALIGDIEAGGPVRGDWPNYGKLGDARHHCHLKKGQPTYVAVWEVQDKKIKLVEIQYVGTHEKAPY